MSNFRYFIIEDEYHAVKRLTQLIRKLRPETVGLGSTDSVEESVDWIKNNEPPDLFFMDIQLADGLSFDIFNKIKIERPVIFTTAFDEYALHAFKSNGIDYLLQTCGRRRA